MRSVRVAVCMLALSFLCGVVCSRVATAQDGQTTTQPAATATVPRLIRMTGSVRDSGGTPLTGSTALTFTLYKDQNDQQGIWQESQQVQLDANGHYNVLLGASTEAGVPVDVFTSGAAKWIGIRADGQAEQPRILFLSVAYALKAADSDMLGGLPVTAFVLAGSQNADAQTAVTAQVVSGNGSATQPSGLPFLASPRTTCSAVTSDGTATANQVAMFTTACNVEGSVISQVSGNVGIGTTSPTSLLDVNGTALITGLLTTAGAVLTPSGTATTSQGYVSNPLDLEASVYNTNLSRGVNYIFQWQAEPVGNDSATTSASLNLLYGVTGSVSETGLSVAKNGVITFASGQTFPGTSGTVTSVATGAGLTGGPITTTGTISIPSAGVTNAMLANSAATVNGQACTLGSTCTVTAAPSGTAGGALSGSYPNPSVASGAITNTMLANNSVTVTAGSGLSGGGTVALGGIVTITNASPSSGGTVTSVATGTGLTGGPITTSGTLSLNTSYLNGLYLQLAGGTLTGGLNGTTGTFSGLLTAMGALMPSTGTSTASKGYISNPFDLQASSYSSSTSAAVTQDFRWQAEPSGNGTSSPSGTLNLLFGSNGGTPAETGFSIAHNGIVTFASGQTFPGSGSGTVTSVATGAGLTGGPVTTSGTISIATGGVTNAMLANSASTVNGQACTLGSTCTVTAAPSGTAGGALSGSYPNPSVASGAITNTMLANNSVTVTAGSGLAGGGTVALGGTVTITNASPSSGGTVTSVASGTGLTGGPITTSGTLSLNTSYLNGLYLQLAGGTLTGGLNGTTGTFSGGLSASTGAFSGLLTAMGGLMPTTGISTASKGYISNPFDFQASSYSSSTSAAVTQDFRWQAEPTGNDTSSPSGTLNLLFGSNGTTPAETGLSIGHNGVITFASGQTFPGSGSGTVTSLATGAGLTGGPVTTSGTISIASAGVTNAMLANPSSTVNGQACTLGSTCTVTAAPSGTAGGALSGSYPNPSVASGAITNTMLANPSSTVNGQACTLGSTCTVSAAPSGTAGGALSGSYPNPSVASGAITNTMLANNSITVTAGSGLAGGGTVALGGTVTITNTSPSSGGTVTSVASGTGLTGGPITTSGTLSLNTSYLNGLYLQLAGGTLTGGLNGTTGTFSGLLTAMGGLMPTTGTSTASKGYISNPFDFQASSYSSSTSAAVTQDFRWQAEPSGNDTSSPSGTLNLLFGSNGTTPAETGLSIGHNGVITFASGQTFPGSGNGTVTSVATGAGLTGGPITGSGTISIASAGVTNAMLANSSATVNGQACTLGSACTVSAAPSGTAGGALTGSYPNPSVASGAITNTMLANASSTVNGQACTLGSTCTLSAAPSGTAGGVLAGSYPNPSVASGAITNTMLANASTTVNGQACALGSTCTVAPGGTAGGALTGSYPNPSVASGAITNTMLANNSITVTAGSGLAGGGTVALGGTVTITNTSPGMGGTVSSVGSGPGIIGGPITTSGTLSLDTNYLNVLYLQLAGGTLTGGLNGTTGTFSGGLTATTGTFSGLLSAAGAQLPETGAATASQGYNSNTFDFQASSYNSSTSAAVPQDFLWQAEPSQNDSSSPSATLNLLFGSNGSTPAETGLSIANNGIITFANGQTFPSGGGNAGTVTSVGTGPGLTGGPITSSGTISIASSGVTNSMLANSSTTVNGQACTLGASCTVAPSGTAGGVLTGSYPNPSVASGAITNAMLANSATTVNGQACVLGASCAVAPSGTAGGVLTGSYPNPSVASGAINNAMLANNSITVMPGSGLSGGGTVALGQTVSLAANLSGATNGVAYFSGPAAVTSTAAPTNGQVLIGSTGNAPALATLTAGQNVTITNGPGSITISASGGGGGAPSLPYFATGAARTGVKLAATKDVVKLWGFLLPYNVTTTQLTYDLTATDKTADDYDIGLYNSSGTLMVNLGPTAGTTFAAAVGFHTLAWSQGSTSLPAGKYYLAMTTNCSSDCATVAAASTNISFAINASAGTTTGGLLTSITPPADSWNTGDQPSVVIH